MKSRNYLRVRGEYRAVIARATELGELPPRARRIRRAGPRGWFEGGTTSACAENTPSAACGSPSAWNYLRVRGEYNCGSSAAWVVKELPPRARRILTLTLKNPLPGGTTSACAENTPLTPAEVATGGNYLRVRGEYGRVVKTSDAFSELPPRARRIHTIAAWAASDNGTTSACAENTHHRRVGGIR